MANFQLFFSRVGLRTYQHPCIITEGGLVLLQTSLRDALLPINFCTVTVDMREKTYANLCTECSFTSANLKKKKVIENAEKF